jgi:RsiW-degrading membrane proteinase PrsW (M82 family)
VPSTPAKPRLPHKWLGPAGGWLVFAVFTFLWFCNVLYDQFVVGRVALTPNSLVLGGFGMAAAFIYTMAYRLRPQDGITPLRLVLTFLLGGLLSTQLAIFIEGPVATALGAGAHGTLVLHSLAGVIEEACKIVTVVIFARGLAVRNARTGLFLGGAVGFGFAAFEDMRYAVESVQEPLFHSPIGSAIFITYSRDLFGPFDHPILTALLAAALFAATRNGRFRITGIVVLAYVGVSVAHGLIDASGDLLALAIPASAAGLLGVVIHVLISLSLGITWLVYSREVNRQLLVTPSDDSPVGSAAAASSSAAPPTGSPSQ